MSNRHFNLPATFGGAVARRPRAILAPRHLISLNLFFGTVHHFEEADAGDSPCQSPWKSIRCCLPGATAESSKRRAVSPARVEKKTMERRKRTRKRRPGIFLLNLTESSFMNPPLYRSISGISQASALSNGRDSRSSEARKRRVPVTKNRQNEDASSQCAQRPAYQEQSRHVAIHQYLQDRKPRQKRCLTNLNGERKMPAFFRASHRYLGPSCLRLHDELCGIWTTTAPGPPARSEDPSTPITFSSGANGNVMIQCQPHRQSLARRWCHALHAPKGSLGRFHDPVAI
ncbi:hypothetical protein HDK90DRAFT_202482 [Phyllosticta capitalensis]|uniref:Uncharacterized protein n=1 Tax=Phyllosticta capitalensis TaxID=121624 RepID=A0ABR1YSS5_9PEZI